MSENNTVRKIISAMEDASVLLNIQTMGMIYMNQSAKELLQKYSTLSHCLSRFDMQQRIQQCIREKKSCTHELQMEEIDFPRMIVTLTPIRWEEQSVVMLTLSPVSCKDSAVDHALMQILAREYFTIIQIQISSMRAQVLHARLPIFQCKPHLSSIDRLLELYANNVIHSSDKEKFLELISKERLQQFANGEPCPAIRVRHIHDGLYRWASYSINPIDSDTLLFFGKDINEEHLNKERNEQFLEEFNSLTIRNQYILSGVSNIFRLLFHVDLKTGETIVCSAHSSFANVFDYNKVYQFEELTALLLKLVHPDDYEKLRAFSSLKQLQQPTDRANAQIMLEYRRISPQKSLNAQPQAKWTRTTIHLNKFENGAPQEAFYIVQDIHEQKIRELETEIRTKSLSDRFYMLLQHRYLWFLDSDYDERLTTCWRVKRDKVTEYTKCPFSRLFELLIIPFCHPEDIKKLAKLFLPDPVKKSFYDGQKKIVSEFRLRVDDTWRWVRIEMDLLLNDAGSLHSLAYICDIDVEKQRIDAISRFEHNQLTLRRKFGLSVQDVYVRVGEIDLDADVIYHYHLKSDDYVAEPDSMPFSELTQIFADSVVHPEQRELFESMFSFPVLLNAVKESMLKIEHRFLLDLDHEGHYIWYNMFMRFFRDENGKSFAMALIQNINDYVLAQNLQIQKLEKTRSYLQANLHTAERKVIRKTHIFSNIAADLKLAFNQVSGYLNELSQLISEQPKAMQNLKLLEKALVSISHIVENATDIMMLENTKIAFLSEKTELSQLIHALKLQTSEVCAEKQVYLNAYTSNIRNELVFCDSNRMKQLLSSLFISFVRCLPNGTAIKLNVTQQPNNTEKSAYYDFIMSVFGNPDSFTQLEKLCDLLTDTTQKVLPQKITTIDEMEMNLNLYICKKLFEYMNVSLIFTKLSEQEKCISLRIPLDYAEERPCVFPQLLCYGKRTIIWEPDHDSAYALEHMLQETGIILHYAVDFHQLTEQLHQRTFDLLMVRQSVLNQSDCQMHELQKTIGTASILILNDAPASPHTLPDEALSQLHYIEPPLFRSTLAAMFRTVFQS